MSEKNFKLPQIAHIVVDGPTQCGKSIVMDRIQKLLTEHFGANVVSSDLDAEKRSNDYSKLAAWERDMIKNTTWVLVESSS